MESFDHAAEAAGALADDLRRGMYTYIRARGRPVGRDEAAAVVGISRKLAAFHLDKLVDKGLLEAHYSRLGGRGGPGAGRPSKVYEPSSSEVALSIPPRAYDLVGTILLDALQTREANEPPRAAARRVAFEAGNDAGRKVRREKRLRVVSAKRALSIAERVLEENGYEPYREQERVRLRNCPFHNLARRSPELVCGLNQAFIEGLLRGLGTDKAEAVLDAIPGQCCVRLEAKPETALNK